MGLPGMNFNELLEETFLSKEPKSECIVRLTTSYWSDNNGAYAKKSIRFLKRKCIGYNFLDEDVSNIGAEEVMKSITNLDSCKDGIYKVIICNERSDWETPHIIDDYDYMLVDIDEINI